MLLLSLPEFFSIQVKQLNFVRLIDSHYSCLSLSLFLDSFNSNNGTGNLVTSPPGSQGMICVNTFASFSLDKSACPYLPMTGGEDNLVKRLIKYVNYDLAALIWEEGKFVLTTLFGAGGCDDDRTVRPLGILIITLIFIYLHNYRCKCHRWW